MARVYFITHPEVTIDPGKPVDAWSLSEHGRTRITRFAEHRFVRGIAAVYASEEQKAREAADVLAAARGLTVAYDPALGENDRSTTGYLPRAEFEATADLFFRDPERSVRGWERACDAQRRIVRAISRIVDVAREVGDTAVVAHGGVGTLLLCSLKNIAITRSEDQPSQGHYFCFDAVSRALVHGWLPLEQV